MITIFFPESASNYTKHSAESFMRRARTLSLPMIPETISDLANLFIAGNLNRYSVDGEVAYKGCVQDTNGKFSIVFASQSLITNALTMCKRELHADATFRIVLSKPKCYQLLTLHGIIENHSISLVYALMESKKKCSYQAVLSYIKTQLLPNFNPRKILTDFETGLSKTLLDYFPSARRIGCWFHHNQAVWKKMKSLGYLNLVNENPHALNTLRRIMVLPLLPGDKINQGLRSIKRYARGNDVNMNLLFDYYERFWIANVGCDELSVYNQPRRTNNHLESFHNKLRYSFGVAHPNLWIFLNKLCNLMQGTSIVVSQLSNGLNPTRNTRGQLIANSIKIKYATQQLHLGLINIKEFLKRFSYSVASYEGRMIKKFFNNQESEDALIESDNESYNRPLSDHETDELFMNQESDVRSVETIDDGDHEFNNILNDNEPNDIGIEENVQAIHNFNTLFTYLKKNHLPVINNLESILNDQMVNIEQDESGNQQDNDWNEEDFIIEEELDPDIIRMMETDNRIRMLEIESLPFVQVPSVLPSITNSDRMCVVCSISEKTRAFIPCGHIAVCGDCLILLDPQRCPLCNQEFTAFLRI
ncbi:RING-type domain-containing protein [Aphis craccivora]|uniref:RING-type domain-containing protein n=1 Tax=Aphis craccivora TaxID=307492 RepID=A0A6G0WH24_APHCR|nr:RING-type domain-containing protein [Aphis craccivora]